MLWKRGLAGVLVVVEGCILRGGWGLFNKNYGCFWNTVSLFYFLLSHMFVFQFSLEHNTNFVLCIPNTELKTNCAIKMAIRCLAAITKCVA